MPDAPTPPTEAPKKTKKPSMWEVYYPFDPDAEKESVPVASFPMIIYFWPALVGFLVCGCLQAWTGISPVALGWWATSLLAFNLMIIVTDLDQKKFVIVLLALVLAGAGLYIGHLKEWAVLGDVAGWIGSLDVRYSTDLYFVLFSFLAVFFLVGMVQPRFDYWRIEPNEFVHYIQPWGRDQSVPRMGSTISREVPDVLELILTFGGGSIVIKREGQVAARIEHVPFLGRRMRAIEKMLGVTRVKEF